MTNNKEKFINLIKLIKENDKLEYFVFIKYITTNSIYFYEFISFIKNDTLILHKIIVMLNINNDFFIQTLDVINTTFLKNNHKQDYSHEYYLIIIYQLLNNHNQWSSLKLNILANNPYKYHYKTIHKKFILYSEKNVFKNTFYNTTINNSFIASNNNLLIDASMMANKMGSENVTVNCEYTKKNCTKLSFVSNTDKIILSVTPYDINNKEIDYNEINSIKKHKKELKENKKNKIKKLIIENKELKNKLKNKITTKHDIENKIENKIEDKIEDKIKNKTENKIKIKTSIHDVMMIQTSINNIKTKFTDKNNITLTGDLGYLTSKKHKFDDVNLTLITPKRQNQKIKNTETERKKLSSRYKIENCFGLLKQHERIILRKDRKMLTFMSFIYIASTIENNKIIQKNKKSNQ